MLGGIPLRPFDPQVAPAAAVTAGAMVVRDALDAPSLWLWFRISGVQELLCPPRAPRPQRCDDLWQHTCLEAFVAESGHEGYWEFNLAPSGHWNV